MVNLAVDVLGAVFDLAECIVNDILGVVENSVSVVDKGLSRLLNVDVREDFWLGNDECSRQRQDWYNA